MNKVKPILMIYSRENGKVTQVAFKLSTLILFLLSFVLLIIFFGISTYGFVTYSIRTYNLNYQLSSTMQELTTLKVERERFKSYLTFIEQTDPITLTYLYDAESLLVDGTVSLEEAPVYEPLAEAPQSQGVKAKPEITHDDGIMKLEDTKITLNEADNIIDINFALRNTKKIPKISGDATFSLIKGNTNEEIPFTKLKATSYVFSNLKQMNAKLTPQDKTVTSNDLVQINLIVDGKLTYSEIISIK